MFYSFVGGVLVLLICICIAAVPFLIMYKILDDFIKDKEVLAKIAQSFAYGIGFLSFSMTVVWVVSSIHSGSFPGWY